MLCHDGMLFIQFMDISQLKSQGGLPFKSSCSHEQCSPVRYSCYFYAFTALMFGLACNAVQDLPHCGFVDMACFLQNKLQWIYHAGAAG